MNKYIYYGICNNTINKYKWIWHRYQHVWISKLLWWVKDVRPKNSSYYMISFSWNSRPWTHSLWRWRFGRGKGEHFKEGLWYVNLIKLRVLLCATSLYQSYLSKALANTLLRKWGHKQKKVLSMIPFIWNSLVASQCLPLMGGCRTRNYWKEVWENILEWLCPSISL